MPLRQNLQGLDGERYQSRRECIRVPSVHVLVTHSHFRAALSDNFLTALRPCVIQNQVYKAFQIPTISQRMYHRGKELDDNALTVSEVEIIDKDTLYLKEIDEDSNAILVDSDLDVEEGSGQAQGQTTRIKPKKQRNEGEAFKGTLLSGSLPTNSSQHLSGADSDHLQNGCSPRSSPSPEKEKPCPSCTFLNDPTSATCEMCDTSI